MFVQLDKFIVRIDDVVYAETFNDVLTKVWFHDRTGKDYILVEKSLDDILLALNGRKKIKTKDLL